jgi:hypothetical protein
MFGGGEEPVAAALETFGLGPALDIKEPPDGGCIYPRRRKRPFVTVLGGERTF